MVDSLRSVGEWQDFDIANADLAAAIMKCSVKYDVAQINTPLPPQVLRVVRSSGGALAIVATVVSFRPVASHRRKRPSVAPGSIEESVVVGVGEFPGLRIPTESLAFPVG